MSPKTPLRADYRFIKKLVNSVMGGKVELVPSEFDLIGRVFIRAQGSWRRLFNGSPQDINLLKKVITRAIEGGHMTKKYKWGEAS